MLTELFTPQALVYVAGGFQMLGMAIINQTVLRALMLIGTVLYIVYYATVSDAPLWDAIYMSGLIGAANILGYAGLVARRSRLAVPAAHADIFPQFPLLPPGDFRSLMKLARRFATAAPLQMTEEDGVPGKLYYVISGTVTAEKAGHRFPLPAGIFVGEVAFLLDRASSASTWLEPGAEVLEWSFADLRRKSARNPRFKLALDAAVSVDLARKVAAAVAPAERSPAAPREMSPA